MATGAVTAGIFAQGTGIENTGTIAAQLARDILARVSGRQVIARIELSGNRRIESTVIYNVIKSSKGKLYSEEDLSADIRAIYRTGYFTDVKADVTDSPDGKVITFILEERPFVNEIRIKGNEAVKADDIRGVLSFKVKQAYNPERIKADTDKIKALYDDKGYYNAEITFSTEKVRDRDVNVIISINEGDLLHIKSITFVGNQALSEKELKTVLDVSEWTILSFITDSGVFKKEKLRENLTRIKVLYQNNGYIQAQVGEPEITHDKKWLYIKIPISEGKQFKVGKVEITGDTLSVPRPELLDKLNIKKKDYYDREAIAKDLEYLTRIVQQRRLCLRRDRPPRRDERRRAEGRRHLRDQERQPRLLQPDQHHRQHQDPGQGHPPAAGFHGRRSLQQRQAQEQLCTAQQAAILRGGELRYGKRSRGKPDGHQHQRQGEAHGDVLDRRRLQRPGRRHGHGPGLPAEPLRTGPGPGSVWRPGNAKPPTSICPSPSPIFSICRSG